MNIKIKDGCTIGGDPEQFAVDANGICIPGFILENKYGLQVIGGDPDETGYIKHPEYLHGSDVVWGGKHMLEYSVMSDGAALEYTLLPSTSSKEFYDRYKTVQMMANQMLARFGLSIFAKPAIAFNSNSYAEVAMSTVFAAAFQFACRMGCDKDYSIYGKAWSEDIDASLVPYRFAGGHVHIFCPDFDMHDLFEPFTKMLDIFLGNLHIAFTPFPDLEAKRQEYYGRPGKIRFQHYPGGKKGIEYRTPSVSFYESYETIALAFTAINRVIDLMDAPDDALNLISLYLERSLRNICTFNQSDSMAVLQSIGLI
jgi:hypothetical protein